MLPTTGASAAVGSQDGHPALTVSDDFPVALNSIALGTEIATAFVAWIAASSAVAASD